MKQFLYSYATGSAARELVNICLRQIGDIPEETNLGFIYATDALADELEHILHLLQQATGIQHWTGTLGISICARDKELYDQPALAIMLCDFPEDSFKVIPSEISDVTPYLTEHKHWIQQNLATFGIIHGDPTNPSTPELMENLSAGLGEGFFVGGLTSSQTLNLQVADEVVSGGISGILFASRNTVAAGHTQGCSPIGPIRVITEARGNVITEIDQQRALKVLKEDVGEILSRDLNRLGGYVFVGLPLKGSDTGDYMIRNLIGIDAGKEIIAIGDVVEPGDTLMFCHRDGNSARDDMMQMLEKLKRQCAGRQPKGAVYYSCMGRGRHQFGENSEELKMITEVIGEVPLVGFFANGEIFHNRLYGFTGVLNLFF